MKAVIQRVLSAKITVENQIVAQIGQGIVTFLGIEKGDRPEQLQKMVEKIVNYRIFADQEDKMNLSLLDLKLEHLLVSQFTIAGDCSKGRRPSFSTAEDPLIAKKYFEQAIEISKSLGAQTQAGVFQADMKINLINDGPVTFIFEM